MKDTSGEKSYFHMMEKEDHVFKDSKSTKDKPRTPYKKDRSKVVYEPDDSDEYAESNNYERNK